MRRGKYPWDLWTDGKVHDIQKGRDYDCTTAAIRQALYMQAIDRGMTVKTTLLRDPAGIEFQYTKGSDGQTSKPEIKTSEPPEYDYDDRSWISDEAIAALTRDN